MGCDIHLHVEVKIKGKWEHYSYPYINRDYDLFCVMAGVRSGPNSPEPISQPRGLPKDLSVVTKFDADIWNGDAHSASWLSAAEAGEVQVWFEKKHPGPHHPPLFGYLFGNYIDSYIRFPGDGKHLKKLGYEDARLVFWFDN